MKIRDCNDLGELWACVHELNRRHFSENRLMPIVGGGKTFRPKVMFVFINPTARNISSSPDWKGPRFPFIGTKQVWRVFHRAGLLEDSLAKQIEANPNWTINFTKKVLKFLADKGIYITNIVKWTGHDATLPDREKIRLFLPILEREIELVKPESIVTFGLIPFEHLARQKIKLTDYHAKAILNGRPDPFNVQIGSFKTKVIPCYFPVGRGNPKKAVELLRLINKA
jgi:uracil-DNA glycosylase